MSRSSKRGGREKVDITALSLEDRAYVRGIVAALKEKAKHDAKGETKSEATKDD